MKDREIETKGEREKEGEVMEV
jgi:hypothetical protein